MAAEYARANKAHLERSVGGTIGDTELYLAHFLGPAGAERFLSAMHRDPDRIAANILPEAANANRAIFYGQTGARPPPEVSDRFSYTPTNPGPRRGPPTRDHPRPHPDDNTT